MNQLLFGGKWGESVWCNGCQQHMGGPLAVCPKCGCNQDSDHIADTGKMVGCAYCDTNLLAGSECSNCGRVTIAEPANTRSTSKYSEPVKQEPVYAFRRRGLDDFCTCTKERYEELADMPNLFEVTTFYAAPVSVEAIRAEALEEAAKVCRTAQAKGLQSIREAIEAAIRGLK